MNRSSLTSTLVLASLSLCPPLLAQWVEPAKQLLTIPGRQSGDLFGWRVRALGDVDRDGVADIAIAAPFDNLNLGRVSVHSGVGGAELWGRTETTTSSIFGFDLAVIEDIDNDGAPEVVAGAPFSAIGGIVQVCSGRTGQLLHTFKSTSTLGSLGYSIATGGDFDGDRVLDLAIGDPDDASVKPGGGRIYVYSVRGFRLVATIDPQVAEFALGTSLAFVGDVNRDGRDDLAVGSRVNPTATTGGVHLISWNGSAPASLWTVQGADFGMALDGNKLAGRGDVNGDGVPDVALDEGQYISRARVLSGLTGALLHSFTDIAADMCGTGATIVPDLNGDHLADVLVGAARNSTRGHYNGRLLVRSGRDGRLLRQLTHTVVDARFGFASDLLPDRTGDGFPELLVGAPGVSGFTRSFGAVHVIAGEPALAGWRLYGAALPGPGGPPTLALAADPLLGAAMQLRIGSPLSGSTPGVLLLGFRELALPTAWSGTLLVAPVVISPVTVPAGGLSVPIPVPDDASLGAVPVFMQAMLLDTAAPASVIESRGLRAQLGR